MNKTRHARIGLGASCALLLTTLLSLPGCTDAITSPEDVGATEEFAKKGDGDGEGMPPDIAALAKQLGSLKKAQHMHLLAQALVSGGVAGKIEEDTDSVRLVIGTNASETADSVLNVVLEDNKVFNRFEYKSAVRGRAVTVAKTNLVAFSTALENSEGVDTFEPDPEVPVDNTSETGSTTTTQQTPWGLTDIGAEASWSLAVDAAGEVPVDIYILDTGVDHTDLNIVECLQFSRRLGAEPCSATDDTGGHGTEVAGVAGAKNDAAGIVGVAPGARIHVFKTLNKGGKAVLSSFIKVVDHITARKLANPSVPIVVNMSLGANVRTTRYNKLDQAIRNSIAAGVVYVLAAGNDQIDVATVTPAHVQEAITVGSYNQTGNFAWFSNYGTAIDLLAPGVDVLTLTSGGGTGRASGTSFSAPYVAGAAALLLAQNPSMTPAQVRDELVARSRANILGVPSGTTNRSLYLGQ
jgi:subtilisin family serine protease